MEYATIRVEAEKTFSEDLRTLFAADILDKIVREAEVESRENHLLAVFEGHSFKITEKLAPRIHHICQSVQGKLGLEDSVEFFVESSRELNCAAIARMDENQPHIVVMKSGILDSFDDEELRFIIGHELGHLISRNAELQRIISFVFPPGAEVPTFIADKVATWDKLSELSADRFGFIAAPDLAKCRSVFFKLSSGLDADRIDFDAQAYQESMDEVLEYFRTSAGAVSTSHPVNPVRLKALQFFQESDLYVSVKDGGTPQADKALTGKMQDLIEILLSKGHSPLAGHRKSFLTAAGLLIAGADQEIAETEFERVLATLSYASHFPRRFLDEMIEKDNVVEIFNESVQGILTANPGERFAMFDYMIEIAMADRRIRQPEVDLLFEIGQKVFGFQRKEIAQMLTAALQKKFVPSFLG